MSAPTQQPWRLSSVTQPLSLFTPVLAVTLVRRRAGRFEVLTGVRTAAANRTHPGVVSVPTLRVPEAVAAGWLDGLGSTPDVSREVEHLLARKLGVADALELGDIALRTLDVGAWQGTSVIGEDQHGLVTEDLTMFNACVEVVGGGELFPSATASYRPLLWAAAADFLRMVRTREVGQLNADLDELMFCAYGLCLETAARIIQGGSLNMN